MQCSTTLSDAIGSGFYTESSNTFSFLPETVESTPMTASGVNEVTLITQTGWIHHMGRLGSEGLRALINETSLDDPTMKSEMEDTISYMHALSAAKLVDYANIANGWPHSPYIYTNSPIEIVANLFQMGFSQRGVHQYFIVFFGLNAILATASAFVMFRFPPMPLNPTEPLSVLLLALNSPQTGLLNGTSVGRLPGSQHDSGGGQPMRNWHKPYEELALQLEADDNKHLQLIAYGDRGVWRNPWIKSHPPKRGISYR